MLSAVSSPSASTVATMQSLRSLNKQVSTLQTEIATGKRVNTAKDNAAVWSLSRSLQSDLAINKEMISNLSMASGAVAAASAGAEAIVTVLEGVKKSVAQHNANGTAIANVRTEITNSLTEVDAIVAAADFRGTNFLSTASKTYVAGYTNGVATNATVTGATIIAGTDYDALVDGIAAGTYTDLPGLIDAAINEVKASAVTLGASGKGLETRSNLLQALNDNLGLAISSMIDTNMDEAAAKLTALQTQQQLATQLLSITTQNNSTLIQTLFRSF